jgi:hypothetical protein
MVVGEVNKSEEKPKLFPQEILPLEEAPRRFTKQVHFRLYTAQLTRQQLETARDLALAHPGQCPLFLCLIRPTGEIVFLETNQKFSVSPSLQLQQAVQERFGQEAYYAKVDTAVPESPARKWGKGNGSDGEVF